MDRAKLVQTILQIIRDHGFPKKRVSLPFHKVYRAAVDSGFSLDAALDDLKRRHRIEAARVEEKLVFSPYTPPRPLIDAKRVDKHIRTTIRPILKDAGFTKNRGRNWWRLAEDLVGVVNFQSFNRYYAEKYGCTTSSLSVNIGVHCRLVSKCPWSLTEGPELPKESECHLRLQLPKSEDYSDECDVKSIWHVRNDGGNIKEAIGDILRALTVRGLPWLETHLDLEVLLNRYVNDLEPAADEAYFGKPYSPARANVVCAVHLARGDCEAARHYLSEALNKESSPATHRRTLEYWNTFNDRYPAGG